MSIRKRKVSPPKPGMGIDGTLGENFSREFARNPWGYGSDKEDYVPPPSPNRQSWGRATDKDILGQVEAASRPRGDDNWGFDATGPVKEVEE